MNYLLAVAQYVLLCFVPKTVASEVASIEAAHDGSAYPTFVLSCHTPDVNERTLTHRVK